MTEVRPWITRRNTAVLVTRFLSERGVAEVADFMPISNPTVATERHRLVRQVTGIRGSVKLKVAVEPRPDYGRAELKITTSEGATIDAYNCMAVRRYRRS